MTTADQTIEKAIKAAGADKAPRVTVEDINQNIVSEHYFTASEGVFGAEKNPFEKDRGFSGHRLGDWPLHGLTICVLVLRNGFTVTGESACASPQNFNPEIGRRIARENAVAKIWPLMGYLLKQRLYDLAHGPVEWPESSGKSLSEAAAAADVAGLPRP